MCNLHAVNLSDRSSSLMQGPEIPDIVQGCSKVHERTDISICELEDQILYDAVRVAAISSYVPLSKILIMRERFPDLHFSSKFRSKRYSAVKM